MHEKTLVAASSVFAAIGLTSLKIVVGVLTGSLGILSEAAHSGLDLVAAVVTLVAVRVAERPADLNHPYGHGKIENLSALIEAGLLLVTCAFIINEAIQRLFVLPVEVEANIWAFAILLISITVDFSRSRALMRAAQKYQSQALEADALHFSTDIWSSSVVILGLVLVLIGRQYPALVFLEKGDAIAALAVAIIVIFVAGQLGVRSIQSLLDAAPAGDAYEQIIAQVGRIQKVQNVHAVRIRPSGAGWFVDLHVLMDGGLSLTESHRVTERIEKKVQSILPGSDVTVHVEPLEAAKQR